MHWTVEPASRLDGEVAVPGDKSISHRALMLAALAADDSSLEHLADGQDVASTMAAMRALGVTIEDHDGQVTVHGTGLAGLRSAGAPIDCGNSGTTVRLLAGILAGQAFASKLTGDASLRRRPMERIAEPLRAMGARVATAAGGGAPLTIDGRMPLRAITHRPPVASAQIKSCVLLAGLFADGPTTVIEPVRSRDHSERLLADMGALLRVDELEDGNRVRIEPGARLGALRGAVPGDVSSAAYWLVAATLLPGSDLSLPGVGLNPTRAAIVDLLVDWGAAITVVGGGEWHGEPFGALRIEGIGGGLSGGVVEGELVPALIDELPLLAALAPFTEDGLEIRDAAELRVKESDRIATTAAALRALGVAVDEFPDGLAVRGGQRLRGGTVDAAGDHRIALALAAVALAAEGPVTIENAEAMAVSYPGFAHDLERVTRR
ncbi:MAG: 3-phosphoshikimate 1-carboxyvinyltransferase [Acidobacteriota bacterium]